MAKFLCVWDCNGIESVIDITEFEYEDDNNLLEMIKTCKPQPSKFGSIITSLLLRARYNSQRNYEIYAVAVTDGITDKDIFEMFENNPQGSADLIRERGVKIFSDRSNKKFLIT